MMMRLLFALALVLLAGVSADAQGFPPNPFTPQFWNGTAWVPVTNAAPLPVTPSTTTPLAGVTTTMSGGSIATTNTFQSILAASAARRGCTVQNTSTVATDVLFVFFGANGSATKPTAFQLQPGQAAYCTSQNGQPLTDNVSATCADATAANCTFVVGAQ